MKIHLLVLPLLIAAPHAFSMNQEHASDSSDQEKVIIHLPLKRTRVDQSKQIKEPSFDCDEELFKAKRRRVDQAAEDNPATQVFASDVVFNILQQLHGPDSRNFACVSRVCHAAAHYSSAKAHIIANELSKREYTPIRYVLELAQGRDTVTLFGIECNTILLLKCLKEKASLLDESIGDFESVTYLCHHDREGVKLSEKMAKLFSPEEMFALKPLKYVRINYDIHTDENAVVDQVARAAHDFPDHVLALNIGPANIEQLAGDITESLINRLVQYPIISLACHKVIFPQGIGCLSVLDKLRGLSLMACNVQNNTTLPDSMCTNLRYLSVLQIHYSNISSISLLIDNLKHLDVLDISGNAITTLPQTLRNLKLRLLNINQQEPIEAKEIKLSALPCLKKLALTYSGRGNPLADASMLTDLDTLGLGCDQPPRVWKKLKKLKTITIGTAMKKLPESFGQFDSLQSLDIIPYNLNFKIPYESLLGMVRHIKTRCSIFSINLSRMQEIVDLWQLVQMNKDFLEKQLNPLPLKIKLTLKNQIDIIRSLMHQSIDADYLRSLATYKSELIVTCVDLIKEFLASHHPASGQAEAIEVLARLHLTDEKLLKTLTTIAQMLCQKMPIYSLSPSADSHDTHLIEPLVARLQSLAERIDKTIQKMKAGKVIDESRYYKCIAEMQLCTHGDYEIIQKLEQCLSLIANLFFHHAIECNDYTNAAVMLKRGATINFSFAPDNDTPLHIAIHNHEATNDPSKQRQIDHIIYFLIKNGASLDQTNSDQKTPLELISPGSSLNQLINSWRTT